MRLLIYWPEILHYHAARIAALNKHLMERGDELIAVSIRNWSPDFPEIQYAGSVGGQLITLSSAPSAGMQSRESARELSRLLERSKPDCVAILGYDTRVSLMALSWCRSNKRAAILLSESQEIDFPRNLAKETVKKFLVRFYDAAFVSGSNQKEYLEKLGMEKNRIFTGYSAVDNQFWMDWAVRSNLKGEYWRDKLKLPAKYFLSVSRLIEKKNIAGLLRAYALYRSKMGLNSWDLVIVGDGPLMADLRNESSVLGISEYVRFLGNMTAEELGPVYGLASVFILASAHSEQWGLVVNEAMAAGLPVLVSHICGCSRDLVIEGETGYRFDPDDVSELSALLIRMSGVQENLLKYKSNSLNQISAFSLDQFADSLLRASDLALRNAITQHRAKASDFALQVISRV